jgi:hypothetical protein
MGGRRTTLLCLVGVLAPLVGVVPAGAGPTEADTIAIHVRGTAANTSTAPGVAVFTVPFVSLVSGAPAGVLTDRISCALALAPPCTVFDVETTYGFSGGSDIVSRGRWTGIIDLAHPGFLLAATRPDHDTIVSGTGDYDHAEGRVNGWGVVDARDFPAALGYDIFTVIRLVRGGTRVLGTGDRLSQVSPADRIAQYFSSDGDNRSRRLTHFVAQTPLFSLGEAKRFGGAVVDVTCGFGPPPCGVLDVVTHFAYDGGELEVRSEVDFMPDPQRPGFGLVNTRPDHDTITATSGVFEHRTGRLLVSGSVDLRSFPLAAPFEGIGLILFN